MTATDNFRAKAPWIMTLLMRDFPIALDDATAVLGNLGHESGGLTALQEISPTVKGSKGGYGWGQWTGPRRRNFMAWCEKNGLKPASDEANYRFLVYELKNSEKGAIPATKKAKTLEAKVKAFELGFERAGIKHYESRNKWAARARAAYDAKRGNVTLPPWALASAPIRAITPKPAAAPAPASDSSIIEAAQKRLAELQYNPGPADGKMGPLTKGAVLVFRHDNGLPSSDAIDAAFLTALATAQPRKMVPERANATGNEIAAKIPEASAHWWNKYIGGGIGGAGTLALVGDAVAPARGYIDQVKDLAADVPGWVWIAAVVLVAGFIAYNARNGQKASDEAYRAGDRR